MSESYSEIESRIREALDALSKRDKPNIAAAAREFRVPEQRLRARWNGRVSKQERPAANRKLSEDQELAVCQYIDRLDSIGTAVRTTTITTFANSILRRCHTDTATPPPTVSENWARRFLNRHREYYVRKQGAIDIVRKNSHDPDACAQPSPSPSTPTRQRTQQASISTPLTVRSLKRQAEWLQAADLPPAFRRKLDAFIEGSLAQAQAGAQAWEDLKHAKAAEIARAARQKRSRRPVQSGGVMYTDEARNMTRRREEEEAKVALNRAQGATDRKVIAEWKPILKELKQALKDQRVYRSKLSKLRKALCVDIRRSVKLVQ